MANVAIIGTGYVGLSSGACLAHLGHQVTCVDVDQQRIDQLRQGIVPIVEHRLDTLVAEGLAGGRLRFESSAAEAVPGNRFVFLCVPTPQGDDGAVDDRFLRQAVADIAEHLDFEAIVINKSTVPVGSAHLVKRLLGRPDVRVVSNPEFLREGTAVDDLLNPDRIVVGGDDSEAAMAVAKLYGGGHQLLVTDAASAELIKYASNAFLAMRLSFVNEIADLCQAVGGSIEDVTLGMGADHRIGSAFLKPGPGWGGSCFPKDTAALVKAQEDHGVSSALIRAVIATNHAHIRATAAAIVGHGDHPPAVAVWGLTFKAGTDDLRDSPALAVIDELLAAGCSISAYDPTVSAARPLIPAGVMIAPTPVEACRRADVLVVLTEWDEFRWVDPVEVAANTTARRVVDARNLLDVAAWRRAGFDYRGVGRS